MKTRLCVQCGWVYSEAAGDPASGIVPGTAWADVPADWYCPDCGETKDAFEMIER
jgi:rubredoxin-NAD+ reductase